MKHYFHNVSVKDPHPQSLAALVLLTKKLTPKPTNYRTWLKYRAWFLRMHKRKHGKLLCHYCGSGPLKNHTETLKELATLDHVKPLAKGGDRFCSSNLVIACHGCNNRKKDRDVEEFEKSDRIISSYLGGFMSEVSYANKLKTQLYWWLGKRRPFILNDEYKIELLFVDKVNNSAKIQITNIKTGEVTQANEEVTGDIE